MIIRFCTNFFRGGRPMRMPFLRTTLFLSAVAVSLGARPYFGNGMKIGEVSHDSAIIWTRLTLNPHPNWEGREWLGTEDRGFDVGELGENQFPPGALLPEMEGSLMGAPGSVRLSWWPEGDTRAIRWTEWMEVDPNRDFTRQFKLTGLNPGTRYRLQFQGRTAEGADENSLNGSFSTAPGPGMHAPIKFVVSTCQSWKTRDKGTAGLRIYEQMLAQDPAFFVHLGDIVYYDKLSAGGDVDARTPELARFHWNRWYGCSDIVRFHNRVPSFFIKDDHDTITDDTVPGDGVGDLLWVDGLAIFREQVPMGHPTYRSRRWSEDLHFWIVEGRDFRSPNTMPDGPDKTLWGAEQKAWFKEQVLASDAKFKILFSPTPVVGPDRKNKRDNLSNANWQHEGDEIRQFCADNGVFIICGDRHWQYHSIDDKTGVHEFASGASSEAHAGGFSLDRRTDEHQYLAIIGGFLSAEIRPSGEQTTLTFRHHRVDGEVAYSTFFER